MSLGDAEALCVSCGLCCDGTLYGSVAVEEGEAPRLQRMGLTVVAGDGQTTMPQPCGALRGCLCAVYADRPSACARYECALRKDVRAGARGLAEGLAAVARVRALLGAVREDLGLDPAASVWASIVALDAPRTAEEEQAWARAHAGAISAVVELVTLVRGVFDAGFGGGGR